MLPFVESRQLGDALITVIREASFLWAPGFAIPEAEWRREVPQADTEGRILIDCNMIHIRLGPASIIVDPGFDDPASELARRLGLVESAGLLTLIDGGEHEIVPGVTMVPTPGETPGRHAGGRATAHRREC